MKRLLIAVVVLVLAAVSIDARDRTVTLFSRAAAGAAGLSLADVALIETDEESAAALGAAQFDRKAWADGFIDRDEVAALLRAAGAGDVRVRGAGTAITLPPAGEKTAKEALLAKGSTVKLTVASGRVRVTLRGVVLQDGAEGDSVGVQVRKARVVKGVVRADGTVEAGL